MRYLKQQLIIAPCLLALSACSVSQLSSYTSSLSDIDPAKSMSLTVSAAEKGVSALGDKSASSYALGKIDPIIGSGSEKVSQSQLTKAVSKVGGHSELKIRPTVTQIQKSASEYEIPPALLASVIHHESSFIQSARSRSGAVGLTQVMPKYWSHQCKSIWTAQGNVDCGAKILKTYYDSADGDWSKALAFYNVGPNNYERSEKMRSIGNHYAKSVIGSQMKIEKHIEMSKLTDFIAKIEKNK